MRASQRKLHHGFMAAEWAMATKPVKKAINTGKDNYSKFAQAVSDDILNNPDFGGFKISFVVSRLVLEYSLTQSIGR